VMQPRRHAATMPHRRSSDRSTRSDTRAADRDGGTYGGPALPELRFAQSERYFRHGPERKAVPGLRSAVFIVKRPTAILNTQVFVLLQQVAEHVQLTDKPRAWPDVEKIRQAESHLVLWANWLQRNRRTITADEWQLHELSLRWAKGVVKSWRLAVTDDPAAEAAKQPAEIGG